MAKSASLRKILSFVIWLTGVIVSLSVAFAMTDGTLALPKWLGGAPIALIAGWVVIITTVLGVVLAIIDYLT
ncbi:hypothetical protein HYW74_01295 [Candidatus Pacearchaeota archaeon]|nr:hypothetical protein [Candidatus Pacearchaeota archaeon]